MYILGIVFYVFLTMGAVYVIFHIKDFFSSWYKWSIAVIKGIGKAILWVGKKIIGIFKRK